jgi:hypothetical protein
MRRGEVVAGRVSRGQGWRVEVTRKPCHGSLVAPERGATAPGRSAASLHGEMVIEQAC